MNSKPSVSPYNPSLKWLTVPRKPDYPYPSLSYLANSFISQDICHFLREDVTDPPILQTKFSPLSLVQQMMSLLFCTPHHTGHFSFSLSSTCSVISRGPKRLYLFHCHSPGAYYSTYNTWHKHTRH